MGEYVIACYRPKEGQAQRLEELVRGHVSKLRKLGLASDRECIALRGSDGSIVEIFEWKSAEAIQKAHSHPDVKAMWDQFGLACEYVTLDSLPESHRPFAPFQRLGT